MPLYTELQIAISILTIQCFSHPKHNIPSLPYSQEVQIKYNLLRAGFYRLKKDIIFWLFLFVTIGASIFALFRIAESGDGTNLYNYINEYLIYIGLFMSMFISIFVGKEYSEGIIRNKIIMRS